VKGENQAMIIEMLPARIGLRAYPFRKGTRKGRALATRFFCGRKGLQKRAQTNARSLTQDQRFINYNSIILSRALKSSNAVTGTERLSELLCLSRRANKERVAKARPGAKKLRHLIRLMVTLNLFQGLTIIIITFLSSRC
jgi:hypothetical protein